jgi:hypothetical protein
VVGFEFYLSGCTSYRCLQQVILAVLQLVIEVNILRREDRDRVSSLPPFNSSPFHPLNERLPSLKSIKTGPVA